MSSRVFHPDHHRAAAKPRDGARRSPASAPASSTPHSVPPASFQEVAPSVEVFSSAGKNPTAHCATRGLVSRVYERAVKGYAYALSGAGPQGGVVTSGGAKLQLPRDAKKGLGLVQRYLCLQLELPAEGGGLPLSLELAVTDGKGVRRRLLCSTAFREPAITPLHAQVPLAASLAPLRGRWANLCLDVAGLCAAAFPAEAAPFRRLESIGIGPVCKASAPRWLFVAAALHRKGRQAARSFVSSAARAMRELDLARGQRVP